jgi:hypothetical protein
MIAQMLKSSAAAKQKISPSRVRDDRQEVAYRWRMWREIMTTETAAKQKIWW